MYVCIYIYIYTYTYTYMYTRTLTTQRKKSLPRVPLSRVEITTNLIILMILYYDMP